MAACVYMAMNICTKEIPWASPGTKNARSTVHRSAAHIVLRPPPPPTVGCYPQAKNCTPKFSCKKNNKAEFSNTLWPRVYVPTEARMPSVGGGWSHCRSSGSAMRLCSGRVQ